MSTIIELNMNILIHMFILFIILSFLFWVVIAKLETSAISNEVSNNIETTFQVLQNQLGKKLNQEKKNKINSLLEKSTQNIKILADIYKKPDKVMQNNNKKLLQQNIIIGILLFIVIITVLTTLRFACGITGFPIFSIIKENLVLFLGIGLIELLFFLQVASKYIPTKPSQIVTNFINGLKEKLNN